MTEQTSMLRKATRQKAKIKLGLSAVSGAGKTYSALLIAKGLAGGNLSKVQLLTRRIIQLTFMLISEIIMYFQSLRLSHPKNIFLPLKNAKMREWK